ncbi:hypothetical protein [uncultured Methylobacterium sp.]|uniref:hypothetical protein n=1 Tax=uncultured Methylobacterium sp. TaxID=157278 RepID=UPI00259855B6|nr:hypothetical protein [uncultured Methylobacterium sp.]
MRRALLASAILVAGLAGALFAQLRSSGDVPAAGPDPAPGGSGTARERTASLFCEFTNMADQAPRVGFYFRAVPERASPAFALVFRREQDGSQVDFGGPEAPSPLWMLDGSDSPAVLRSPEDDTRIILYGYEPGRTGTVWFEAGLRSIPYKNLGGQCRQSA